MLFENNTRGKILESSCYQMSLYGYDATSIRDIAKAVNITASALYNYFPSKQAILQELVELFLDRLKQYRPSAAEWEAIIQKGSLDDVIDRFIYVFPDVDEPDMPRLMRVFVLSTFVFPEVNKLFFERFVLGSVQYMQSIFDRLIAAGKIRSLDTDLLARAINDAMVFRAMLSCMFRSHDEFTAYNRRFGRREMDRFRETVHRWIEHGDIFAIGAEMKWPYYLQISEEENSQADQ